MSSKISLRLFSAVVEALGCICLYFGSGMLMVPPGADEPKFGWRFALYVIAPLVLSPLLLSFAGWLWSRSGAPLAVSIKRAFQFAFATVALFWAGLIIMAHVYGTMP